MKIGKVTRFCCVLAVLAGLSGGGLAVAAEEPAKLEAGSTELKEMPVMTGEQWQALHPDAKTAFIWGIGHVVTIEEHVLLRHPDLKKEGFVSKLAIGLRGVPMATIIQTIDNFYLKYPDDLNLPVMRVIWGQLVKPKLKTGIADRPLSKQDDD